MRRTRYQIARAGTLQTSLGWSKANGSLVALPLVKRQFDAAAVGEVAEMKVTKR